MLRLAIALTTALLLGAPAADAAVRTLHADDPLDAQDETAPQPHALTPDITTLDIRYDESGAVSIAIGFASVDDQPPAADVVLGCAGTPALTATIVRDPGTADVDQPGWDDHGTARVDGSAATLSSAIHSADGSRTLRAAFTGAPLAGHGYRCATAYWHDPEYPYYLDDSASGWFAGYEPLPPFGAGWPELLDREMQVRFGAAYSAAARRYLECPSEQQRESRDDPGDPTATPSPARARCRYWLRSGRDVTLGALTMTADDQARVPVIAFGPIRHYRRDWRRCRTGDRRKRLRANAPCAVPRQLAAQIFVRATRRLPRALPRRFPVTVRGPGTRGYGELVDFSCRARGGSVRCANAVGERLRLRLRLAPR